MRHCLPHGEKPCGLRAVCPVSQRGETAEAREARIAATYEQALLCIQRGERGKAVVRLPALCQRHTFHFPAPVRLIMRVDVSLLRTASHVRTLRMQRYGPHGCQLVDPVRPTLTCAKLMSAGCAGGSAGGSGPGRRAARRRGRRLQLRRPGSGLDHLCCAATACPPVAAGALHSVCSVDAL